VCFDVIRSAGRLNRKAGLVACQRQSQRRGRRAHRPALDPRAPRIRSFFSLAEQNIAIAEQVEGLDTRRLQKLPRTRREALESLDRRRIKALLSLRFESAAQKTRANVDYHVEFDERLHSLPFKLRREVIEVRATPSVVDCFTVAYVLLPIGASYARPGTAVTNAKHRPLEHKDYSEWAPERAGKFGAACCRGRATHPQYPQPEMGFRPVLGIIRVADKHGAITLDAACQRALAVAGQSAQHRRHIEAVLGS